jgi:hypothetical protein
MYDTTCMASTTKRHDIASYTAHTHETLPTITRTLFLLFVHFQVQDKLLDPISVTNMHTVNANLGCVTCGLNPDAKNLVRSLLLSAYALYSCPLALSSFLSSHRIT